MFENTLTVIRAVTALIPAILEAIEAAELAIPNKGQGNTRLELVKSWLNVAHDNAHAFELVWPAIERTIAIVIAAKKMS